MYMAFDIHQSSLKGQHQEYHGHKSLLLQLTRTSMTDPHLCHIRLLSLSPIISPVSSRNNQRGTASGRAWDTHHSLAYLGLTSLRLGIMPGAQYPGCDDQLLMGQPF